MRNIAGLPIVTLVTLAAASGQAPPSLEFQYLYTFGSKGGIHPPTILSRRPATVALGKAENPYGLVFPVAVVTDLHRRVWITDSGTASVHVFDKATGAYREIRHVAGLPLQQPSGLAIDGQGRIYLTDSGNGGVFVFDE